MSSNRLSFHKIRQLLRLKWDVGMRNRRTGGVCDISLLDAREWGRGYALFS